MERVSPARPVPLRSRNAYQRLPERQHRMLTRGPPQSLERPNNNLQNPLPARSNSYPAEALQVWRSWNELGIKLRGVPPTATTLDLWRVFKKEGSVDFIEIFQDRRGNRDGYARIRFRPPPSRPLWQSGKYVVKFASEEHDTLLEISLEENRPELFVPSPVNPAVKYPRSTVVNPVSVDFGFMYGLTTMMVMYSAKSYGGAETVLELDLVRKCLDIRFTARIIDPRGRTGRSPNNSYAAHELSDSIGRLNRTETYRFRIPLGQLQQIHEIQETTRQRILVISLETPPNFYRKAAGPQLEGSHDKQLPYWSEWNTWFRQTDIVYDPRELRTASLTLKKAKPIIDIGRWTTYRFTLNLSDREMKSYETICRALRDYNIPIESLGGFQVITSLEPAVWQWIDQPKSGKNTITSSLNDLQEAIVAPLSFPVRYLLEACISQGRLNEHNLNKDFVYRLSGMEEEKALDILLHVIDLKKRVYDPSTIFDLRGIRPAASAVKIPHYCVYTRKATITPSMIYFSTPTVETSNRVVRQYIEHSDRFLRVQFADEKFQGRINSTDRKTNDEVFTRIRRALINGITIGDRHFEFLAFGNSQFREHGAYFFAPTIHLRTGDIRRWMGDFSHIRTVALYAARLGQCFSTTRAINGTKVQVRETLDVKNDKYNFTDGVGKISEALAKLVAGELRLPFVPSVFQFRLGGCKGVLAVWPDAQRWEIYIRPSQYKFPAIHNGLEIIRWSQFAAAALNRQLIIVLSILGVRDDVFMAKLEDMLANLQRAMIDQTLAVEMLQRNVDPNQMTLVIASMALEGFMRAEEPFMMSLLRLWRAWTIKYLKERAKIIIDQGAFLFGCTDETKTLKGHFFKANSGSGSPADRRMTSLPEIFVQIPDQQSPGKYRVVEGPCLLARNPSLHPGDIRVVRAVDNKGLRHIRDAVVLPQTGDRDVASMCSGGDLDGDDYLVIWDQDLIPKEWDHPPMDYSPPKPAKLDRQVSRQDITDFFVQYMKNDQLPTIAYAHLAQADQADWGVKDEKCIRLAALHSKAVDYVKTGEPAVMPRELRPRVWPHFMEKRHVNKEQIYRSRKILGRLYDQVEMVDFVPSYDAKFDSRILEAYELDESLAQTVRELKRGYDTDMRRIMAQHEIKTEAEVWSTFVLSHGSGSKDYKFHEEMGQIASALKERYRNACVEKAGSKDFEALGPFVAAMYQVTQQEVNSALSELATEPLAAGERVRMAAKQREQMPLISFPWCFPDILAKIANNRNRHSEAGSAADVLENVGRKPSRYAAGSKLASNPAVNKGEHDVETTAGVSHSGEILELFHHQKVEDLSQLGVTGRGANAERSLGGPSERLPETITHKEGEAKQSELRRVSPENEAPPHLGEREPSNHQSTTISTTSHPEKSHSPSIASRETAIFSPAQRNTIAASSENNLASDNHNRVVAATPPAVPESNVNGVQNEEEWSEDLEEEEIVIDESKETAFEALERVLG